VFINDRFLAPNTPDTRAALESEFRTFFSTLFGEVEYTLSYRQDSRSLFSVTVRASQAFDANALLNNLNSLTPASH